MLKLNFADLSVLTVTVMTMFKMLAFSPADKFRVCLRIEPQSHLTSLEGARCTYMTTR